MSKGPILRTSARMSLEAEEEEYTTKLNFSFNIPRKCFNKNQPSHIPTIQPYALIYICMRNLWISIEIKSHAFLMSPIVDWCFPRFVDLIENTVKILQQQSTKPYSCDTTLRP